MTTQEMIVDVWQRACSDGFHAAQDGDHTAKDRFYDVCSALERAYAKEIDEYKAKAGRITPEDAQRLR